MKLWFMPSVCEQFVDARLRMREHAEEHVGQVPMQHARLRAARSGTCRRSPSAFGCPTPSAAAHLEVAEVPADPTSLFRANVGGQLHLLVFMENGVAALRHVACRKRRPRAPPVCTCSENEARAVVGTEGGHVPAAEEWP
jgi:hypothetical protein